MIQSGINWLILLVSEAQIKVMGSESLSELRGGGP